MKRGLTAGVFLFLATTAARVAAGIELSLPTDNDALFRGDGAGFYQAIERDLHGVISHPWEGGRYGFVRDPVQANGATIFTRFHEGMDIRPLRRDAHGEPLDDVRAIAAGKVVYTNLAAGASNYGRYVVVEHRWDGCPYYSLYAHLSTIAVSAGELVRQNEKLAIMGHTGAGIDRARAHVHVELNLLLSDHFEAWHDIFFKGETNHHGIYNGLNLAGLDLPALFLALRVDPQLTIPAFLRREEVFYKVIMPNSPNFELPGRYPWMVERAPNESPASWEISFARSGLPLRITASAQEVARPRLSFLQPTPIDARAMTRGNISGRWPDARLTKSGEALMRLLAFPD